MPLALLLLLSPLCAAAQGPLAASSAAVQSPASAAFARLAEEYWETLMRLDPLEATFLNHPGYNDKLPDNSAAGRAQELADLSRLYLRLSAVNRAALPPSEKISWDIMKRQIDMRREQQRYKFWQWSVDHMDGPQAMIPTLIELAQPMGTDEDASNLIRRLEAMPAFFAAQIQNLREGMAEKRVAARINVEKTISGLKGMLEKSPENTPFAAAAKKLPEEIRARRLPDVVKAVENSALPAFRQYLDFLEKEYLDAARVERVGLGALPGGASAYRYMIRFHTTLEKTPEELHQVGLDEIKGIHAEMEAIAKRRGHSGDLKSFFNDIRNDPDNFFKTREEVLQNAKDLVAKAQERLPKFFGLLPKTPLLVKPVEEYNEKNEVAARYFPPPDDLSRPGIYYINTYEPETRPRFSMASLAAHEGVPGHHLQIAIATEQRGLPQFRRHAGFTAFVEGWALYSERLADEMGLYEDELSKFGMLTDQAFRACRLVVDTGIHAMEWSRQEAIDFMKQNTPMSEAEIVAEVDRYIMWPGQALAYKVGQREIAALRQEAEAARGKRFDIRAFHDTVLKNGAVPLPTLRQILASF